jgi:hypothetical protein
VPIALESLAAQAGLREQYARAALVMGAARRQSRAWRAEIGEWAPTPTELAHEDAVRNPTLYWAVFIAQALQLGQGDVALPHASLLEGRVERRHVLHEEPLLRLHCEDCKPGEAIGAKANAGDVDAQPPVLEAHEWRMGVAERDHVRVNTAP